MTGVDFWLTSSFPSFLHPSSFFHIYFSSALAVMPPRRSTRAVARPSYAPSASFSPPSSPHPTSRAKPKRRRHTASNAEEEEKDLDHVERGGSKAEEVYDTLEIRENILQYLDKATLASFLRVEKGGIACVAGVLYHTVAEDLIPKMSRGNVSTF